DSLRDVLLIATAEEFVELLPVIPAAQNPVAHVGGDAFLRRVNDVKEDGLFPPIEAVEDRDRDQPILYSALTIRNVVLPILILDSLADPPPSVLAVDAIELPVSLKRHTHSFAAVRTRFNGFRLQARPAVEHDRLPGDGPPR